MVGLESIIRSKMCHTENIKYHVIHLRVGYKNKINGQTKKCGRRRQKSIQALSFPGL